MYAGLARCRMVKVSMEFKLESGHVIGPPSVFLQNALYLLRYTAHRRPILDVLILEYCFTK